MMIQKFQCLLFRAFKMSAMEVHGLLKNGALALVSMLMCWFMRKL